MLLSLLFVCLPDVKLALQAVTRTWLPFQANSVGRVLRTGKKYVRICLVITTTRVTNLEDFGSERVWGLLPCVFIQLRLGTTQLQLSNHLETHETIFLSRGPKLRIIVPNHSSRISFHCILRLGVYGALFWQSIGNTTC